MDYALLQKIYNIKLFVGYTDEEIKELRAGFEKRIFCWKLKKYSSIL